MAQKTILSTKVKYAIGSFKNDLLRAGIQTEKLILFGSHVKGDVKPWSDIDVCVVSDSFKEDLHGEMVRLLTIRSESSLDIEPHPYTSHGLLDQYDPLAAEIRRYGKVI